MVTKSSPAHQLQLRQAAQRAARAQTVPTFGVQQVVLNASSVPAPAKIYTADKAWVTESGGSFLFLFWQSGLTGEEAASAIGIKMHAVYVQRFLASVDEMDAPTLDDICGRFGIEPSEIGALTVTPVQSAKFTANIAMLAISGYEASIDFHEASPAALHKAKLGSDVELDPIVRVMLDSALLLAVIRRTKTLMVGVKGVVFDAEF